MAEARFVPLPAVPLAPLSTLRVGGPARWFARAKSLADVAAAHRWCDERRVPLIVLGGGSNLVIADRGVDGLVLQIALTGIETTSAGEDTLISAAAGESWDALVAAVVGRGLTGIECLSGIPGSVGGTPIQNVGAYGQEVSETIYEVAAFDRTIGELTTIPAAACGFEYRNSRFKRQDAGRFIVCGATFRLRPGAATATYPDLREALRAAGVQSPSVSDVRRAVLAIRRRKGMVLDPADVDTRSVGSFFMNPVTSRDTHGRIQMAESGRQVPGFALASGEVKIPAAWLIERSGFSKGHQHGPVGLSSKHSLAIVNRGGATARDVLDLALRIKRAVADRFDILLRPEPVFVGFEGNGDVEELLRAHP